MSQHDMTLDNASGLGFRTDANNALQALASQSGGAAAPSPSFPCQVWADTGTGRLRQRNSANTVWLDMGSLDTAIAGQLVGQEMTAFTSSGTAPAFALTPSPAITAYAAPQRFRVKFHAASPTGGTLNVSGIGAKNLKQYDSTGSKGTAFIAANQLADVEYDGTDFVIRDPLPDPWAMMPLGQPIGLLTNLTGVTEPPTTSSYRYIKLTASDAYNSGVLTSESVSGSAPLVIATATISLAGSPMNGQVVSLINTEARVLRAGTPGALLQDAMEGHTHGSSAASSAASQLLGAGGFAAATIGTATGPVIGGRTATETRAKSIGVNYYMRIK